jgi:hypothetical protein
MRSSTRPSRLRSFARSLAPLFRRHLGCTRLPTLEPALAAERDGGGILTLIRVRKRWRLSRRLVHDLAGKLVYVAREFA